MKILLSVLMMLLLSGCGGWSWKDTAREATFGGTTYYAYKQVSEVSKSVDKSMYAENYVEFPTTKDVQKYFTIYSASHLAIAMLLPPEYRSSWQWLGIGVSTGTAVYGFNMKINIP
jgi:uncharacterized protein YceK